MVYRKPPRSWGRHGRGYFHGVEMDEWSDTWRLHPDGAVTAVRRSRTWRGRQMRTVAWTPEDIRWLEHQRIIEEQEQVARQPWVMGMAAMLAQQGFREHLAEMSVLGWGPTPGYSEFE